jgi:signal peptidase I
MFPTLRPEDRVIVKPLAIKEFPKPGCIVIYLENNGLVMHRLIEIRANDQNNPQLITRGDSLNEPDKPWPQQKLLGVAVTYKRTDKEHSLKSYIPGAWRYKFNHRLIWFYIKMKNLSGSI